MIPPQKIPERPLHLDGQGFLSLPLSLSSFPFSCPCLFHLRCCLLDPHFRSIKLPSWIVAFSETVRCYSPHH